MSIANALPDSLLQQKIIPVFIRSFHQLSSLSLIWKEGTISDPGLKQISRFDGLSQPQLCPGGEEYAWTQMWLIDHAAVHSHMSKLPYLRKLFFSRDTYDYYTPTDSLQDPFSSYRHYFNIELNPRTILGNEARLSASRKPDSDDKDEDDTQARLIPRWDTAPKKMNRMRMLAIANEHAHSLSTLSWIHLGRMQFAVRRKNTTREVVGDLEQITRERSSSSTEDLFYRLVEITMFIVFLEVVGTIKIHSEHIAACLIHGCFVS